MFPFLTEVDLATCIEELTPWAYNLQLVIGEDECLQRELNEDCCDWWGGGWDALFLKHVIWVNPLISDQEEVVGKLYNTYAEAAAYAVAQDPVGNNEYRMIEFWAGDHTAESIDMYDNVHIKGQEYLTTYLGDINVNSPFSWNFFANVIYWVMISNLFIGEWSTVLLHNTWNLVWMWSLVNQWQIICIQDCNVSWLESTDNSNNIFIESRVDTWNLWWDVRWQDADFIEIHFQDFVRLECDSSSFDNCSFWDEIDAEIFDWIMDSNTFTSLLESNQSSIVFVWWTIIWSWSYWLTIPWSTNVYLQWIKSEWLLTIYLQPWTSLITIDCQNIKVVNAPWTTWINDDWLINTTGFVNLDPWYFSRTVQELFDWIEANWPSIPWVPQIKQDDFISVLIEVAQDKTYKLVTNSPIGWTILWITTISSSGNATWAVTISWNPVTVPNNAISTVEDYQITAGNNNFVVWDSIEYTISGNNFAEDVTVTIHFNRDLA